MLRQVSTYPRLISNDADATSTDTVHRVFAKPGVDMHKLTVAALSSATMAMSEVLGRSYGGGLLEVEPSEATAMLLPNPIHVDSALIDDVDQLLRIGDIEAAIEQVDRRILVESLGFTSEEVETVRQASARLRDRRLRRGRGGR